jgi:hypothetical protein
MRFSIRDLLWLMLVVALVVGHFYEGKRQVDAAARKRLTEVLKAEGLAPGDFNPSIPEGIRHEFDNVYALDIAAVGHGTLFINGEGMGGIIHNNKHTIDIDKLVDKIVAALDEPSK